MSELRVARVVSLAKRVHELAAGANARVGEVAARLSGLEDSLAKIQAHVDRIERSNVCRWDERLEYKRPSVPAERVSSRLSTVEPPETAPNQEPASPRVSFRPRPRKRWLLVPRSSEE